MKVEITSAEKAFETLRDKVSVDVEEFWALALGPKKTLLASRMIFRGTVDSCLVHPRDIFRFACLENASSLLVAHNHPSGDLIPSQEDLRFTRQLLKAAEVMEIPIVDHLILTPASYASLRSDGWCRFETRPVRSV
ncbi:MAG: JAB domain-containing protein [Bdellovibrionota bacterium]